MSRRRSRPDGTPRTIAISTRTWTIALWAILAAIGFHLFRASAHAWGDSIIDLGRDLTIPSELLAGRVLYREVLYNYGPVVPYLLAGVVRLFGDGLNVFAGYGVAVGLATVAALWTIGRQVGRPDAVIPWAAFFSALIFVVCCFFANTSWGCNFVLPYSFAATTATAFSLWSFSFLLQHLEQRDRRSFYLSGAFLILTVFTKHEVGAGIAAVHVVTWVLHGVDRRALIGVIGAGLVVGGTFAFVFAAHGPGDHTLLAENILKPVTGVEMFHAAVGGFADPVTNGLHMVVAVMQLALIATLAGIGGLFAAWRRQAADAKAALAALSLAASALLIWLWADAGLLHATPLLAVGAIAIAGLRNRRDPFVLLAIYALVSGLRVLLEFGPMWYGFFLTVPAFPFIVHVAARLSQREPIRRMAALGLAATAVLAVIRFDHNIVHVYLDQTSVLETPKGRLRDFPTGRSEVISAFLDYARTDLADGHPSMVVMPEGMSLNYFTGFQNPTAYSFFIPPEIPTPEVEARMVAELSERRPDLVVITTRDVSEYGRRAFGDDYAQQLGDWVRAHYVVDRVFEAGPEPWRLTVMKRRPTG